MTNRRSATLRTTGLAGAALLLSGCAVFSPVTTQENYLPSDGTQLLMPGLELSSLVVVAAEEGGPGVLVGQAVNGNSAAVEVTFGLEGSSATATATVPAYREVPIASTPNAVSLDSVPAAPGQMVNLLVTTREAGQNVVQVPVLLPTNQYEGLLSGL